MNPRTASIAHAFLRRHVKGLIEASKDPQFRKDVKQNVKDLPGDTKNFLKGVAVGDAGFASELMQGYMEGETGMFGVPSALKNIKNAGQYETPKTDDLGEMIGADTESKAYTVGTYLGMPDVADLMKGGAKFLPALLGMTSWHGTPHPRPLTRTDNIEDVFSNDKILSGEGNTAFGWGHYFSEKPGVAHQYKPKSMDISPEASKALDKIDQLGFDSKGAAITAIRAEKKAGNDWTKIWDVDPKRDGQDVIDAIEAQVARKPGQLLEVDIPDETVAKMLDWDAPLSEQPESVKKAIKNIVEDTRADESMTGGGFYRFVEEQGTPDKLLSKELKEAGIPGIKYFDGGSRGKLLSKSQFEKKYSKHIDIRGRKGGAEATAKAIQKDGFKGKGAAAVNVLPVTESPEHLQSVVEKAYKAKTGDTVYLVPDDAIANNKVKVGWKPKDGEIVTLKEGESLYDAYRRTNEGTRNLVVFDPHDIREVKAEGKVLFKK